MNEMGPRFEFFEKVRVHSTARENACVTGQIGAILGRVETEDASWYYTVHIYSTQTSWCFFENELLATGDHARREDFYDGWSIRVNVDEDGSGTIKAGD
jgi:Immunity protein 31